MRKFKILFITGKFYPTQTANTINTKNIIDDMKKKGHDVTCIAINQDEGEPFFEYDSIPVYSVKSTKYARLLELKKESKLETLGKIILKLLLINRKIRNIIKFYKFPNVNPSQSKKVYRLAEKLHKKENFDCMIGVFRPFSGVAASISMKKKFPELICGAYYLDLISGSTKPTLVPKKIYENLCFKGEIKAFTTLDFILMAKGGEATYSVDKYKSVNAKIQYIDFPVFITDIGEHIIDYDESKINLVYAGTLDKNYRNPTYMLRHLNEISKQVNGITLHIYGRGNCSSIIQKYKKESSYEIIEHGMVPHAYVVSAMQQADFLINISNSTQNIVPSKIFELFSTGRPILNFISNKSDISNKYFDNYPSVCNILEYETVTKQISYLKMFLLKEKGKFYPVEKLKKSFIENTPEFTGNKIEEYILAHEKYRNV